MANAAKVGTSNLIDASRELVSPFNGQMMSTKEFDSRLDQGAHNEWDLTAQKLRWVE